jgi:hypothetical protein
MARGRITGGHSETDRATPRADEVRAARELPDVRARIAAKGFEIKCSTPEVFAADYQKELPVWERLIRQSGAKLEWRRLR